MKHQQESIFWMVWNPEGRAPTYQHYSVENAKAEAKRLAVQCPGSKFFVLMVLNGYVLPKPEPEEIEIDEIPF